MEQIDPEKLKELEEATGIALATSHVDLSQVRKTKQQDFVSEEQRLMPRYVEEFFDRCCKYLNVKLEEVNHQDAEFVSPGHPLFAAIAERLKANLEQTVGFQSAVFSDADAVNPYSIHFYHIEIAGEDIKGNNKVIRAVMKALVEKKPGSYQLISTDCLHDLTSVEGEEKIYLKPPTSEKQQQQEKWLKVRVQFPLQQEESQKRQRDLEIRDNYLQQEMEAAIKEAQKAYLQLASKVAKGNDKFRIARDNAQNKVNFLKERLVDGRRDIMCLCSL